MTRHIFLTKSPEAKSILAAIILLLINVDTNAQTKKNITVDGRERTYLIYTPKGNTPKGIIVSMHGMNGSASDFFDKYTLQPYADRLKYTIISPQALPEQDFTISTEIALLSAIAGLDITASAVWGAGLKVKVASPLFPITIEINAGVQDENFIKAIIDETVNTYPETKEKIFLLGTSFGGFMAYQYAMKHPENLAGLISIAGSMGTAIDGDSNVPVALCDFHSIDDEVVYYEGQSRITIDGIIPLRVTVTLAQAIPTVINYWIKRNNPGEGITEDVKYHPSNSKYTATRTIYPQMGKNSREIWQYTITNAPHSYFFKADNGDCMDYGEEIIKFITSVNRNSTGIKSANTTTSHPKIVAYYNLLGQKLHSMPERGIYITLYDDGTAQKTAK